MNLIQYALAQQIVDSYGAKDASIANIELDSKNNLIVTLTDGRVIKAGQIPTVSQEVVTQIVTERVNEVETKVNTIETQTNSLGLALESTSKDLAILQQTAVTQVTMGDTNVTIKDNVLNLPMASGEVIGLVMAKIPSNSATSVNQISINENGYLEIGTLSTDKLVQGEHTLILDCSETF